MEQLHLVGCTPDLKSLVFSRRRGSTTGDFWVAVDDRLLSQIEEATSGPRRSATRANAKPRSPSLLTPREMQARLRVGRTIAEVAEEAGVDEEWVTRFAGPILAEQERVVALALAATPADEKHGTSKLPLGASVARNLTDSGTVLPEDVLASAWSAYQLGDGLWGVRFCYESQGHTIAADWDYDAGSGKVAARNPTSAELGFVGRGARRPSPKANEAAKSVAAAGRRAPKAAVTAPLPFDEAPAQPPASSRPRARRQRPLPDH